MTCGLWNLAFPLHWFHPSEGNTVLNRYPSYKCLKKVGTWIEFIKLLIRMLLLLTPVISFTEFYYRPGEVLSALYSLVCFFYPKTLWGNYVNFILQMKEWGLERLSNLANITQQINIRAGVVYRQSPCARWMVPETWMVHRPIHLICQKPMPCFSIHKTLLNFGISQRNAFCYLKHFDTAKTLAVLWLLMPIS